MLSPQPSSPASRIDGGRPLQRQQRAFPGPGPTAWPAIAWSVSVIQAGAASRNGVSLGSGSIKTLTPEDADAILHECPSVDSLSPLVFTRRQLVFGNRNWVPSTFVGITPGYLRVREWEELEEGETFTDRDVRDVAMVCLLAHWALHGTVFGRRVFAVGDNPRAAELAREPEPLDVAALRRRFGARISDEELLLRFGMPAAEVDAMIAAGPMSCCGKPLKPSMSAGRRGADT